MATGIATFEYRDYAFLGDGSVMAAEALSCAGDQGKFWEYHDLMYFNVDNPALPGLSRPSFDLFAEQLELDMAVFGACLDNHTHLEAVNRSKEEGTVLGVKGTPAILINGELVTGIETYDDLFRMIEEAAASS